METAAKGRFCRWTGCIISRNPTCARLLRADRSHVTVDAPSNKVVPRLRRPRADIPKHGISERIVLSYIGLHRARARPSVRCCSHGDDGQRELRGGSTAFSFRPGILRERLFSPTPPCQPRSLWLAGGRCMRQSEVRTARLPVNERELRTMGAVEILPQREYRPPQGGTGPWLAPRHLASAPAWRISAKAQGVWRGHVARGIASAFARPAASCKSWTQTGHKPGVRPHLAGRFAETASPENTLCVPVLGRARGYRLH